MDSPSREASPPHHTKHVPVPALPPTVRIIYTGDKPKHSPEFSMNFNKGVDCYHANDFEGALQYFSAADRAEPGQPQCVVMLGVCYELHKKPLLAIGVYNYALQLDPHNALAWHNKALLHAEMGETQEAKRCYLNSLRDRLLTGTPELHTVGCNLASVLLKLGEKESALRILEEVLASNEDDHMAAAWLSDIHAETGNYERAYQLLQRLPDNGRLRPGMMLLAKNKLADLLVNLSVPGAFRLPKAPRLKEAYEKAVAQTVRRLINDCPAVSLKVIDCDSVGWLALTALQSGAKQACCLIKPWTALGDGITATLLRNGIPLSQAPVKFYPGDVAEALGDEAKDADLIVNAIYAPAQVPTIMNRIKIYKDRGLLTVPRSGTVRMMGITSDQIRTQCTVGSEVNAFDLTAFGDLCLAIRKYVMSMHMSTIPHAVLTEVVSLDLGTDETTDSLFGRVVDLPVLEGGRLDAIVSWYDLDLADGVSMSMGPDPDCAFQQNVQIINFDGDGTVAVGDKVRLTMTLTRWTAERSHQWIMFEKAEHQVGDTVKQTHETFLNSEDPLEGRLWHFDMMADIGRNNAYQRALELAVTPDSVVLDIGTGSGLLAMMAARAGARHVYAIEGNPSIAQKARNVIAANGYEDKITVITGMSSDVKVEPGGPLPELADLVVTETMGADLLSELMYNILDDARDRLVKPGGRLIPGSGRVLGQLIQVDSPWHLAGFPPTEGLAAGGPPDLSAFTPLMCRMRSCLQIRKVQYKTLSEPFTLFAFDFQHPLSKAGYEVERDVLITAPGTLHAIACWWDADLGPDADGGRIVIETGPDSRYAYTDHAHWSQQLQSLDLVGRPVQPEDLVPLRCFNDNHLSYIELRD